MKDLKVVSQALRLSPLASRLAEREKFNYDKVNDANPFRSPLNFYVFQAITNYELLYLSKFSLQF